MKNITYNKVSAVLFIFCLLLGFVQFWQSYFSMDTDFMAYSDIADAYLEGNWQYALNSSWPPLFSWLLTILITLATSPESEIVLCHLLQLVFFTLSLVCIWMIIPQLSLFSSGKNLYRKPLKWDMVCFIVIVWVLSTIFLLSCNPIVVLSPDAVQMPIALAIFSLMLSVRNKGLSTRTSLSLGTLLAIGYYAKTLFFFLWPIVCFSTILLTKSCWKKRTKYALIITVVFLALISPYITAISIQQNRFTIGDSGAINYGVFVSNEIRRPRDKDNLLIISEKYPFHDPMIVDRIVWERPQNVHFKVPDIVDSFITNVKLLFDSGTRYEPSGFINKPMALTAILFFLYLFFWRRRHFYHDFLLFLPAISAMLMYLVIIVMPRYRMIWLTWINLISLTKVYYYSQFYPRLRNIGLVTLLSILMLFAYKSAFLTSYQIIPEFNVAKTIEQTGAKNLCIVGLKLSNPLAERIGLMGIGLHWVRHTQCRILAYHFHGQQFYSLSKEQKEKIYDKLLASNIDSVLFVGPTKTDDEWLYVGRSFMDLDYYLLLLNKET